MSLSRRDLLVAASVLPAAARQAAAQERLTQEELLRFQPLGQVTLLHLTDLHSQARPMRFREAALNIGIGESRGQVPHLTGAELRQAYGVPAGSAMGHALSHEEFDALSRRYGRMGGLDRIATLVRAIRAERGADRTLLLDGGDTLQGSWVSLQTKGEDCAEALRLLGCDATTGHWEFTYGEARVKELAEQLPFLAHNIEDNTWNEDVFAGTKTFERGGIKVAVIGQAFPYTPISNPRWMIPEWGFGIREEKLARTVVRLRGEGAQLVVLLSHNGFDVDRKLAGRVPGIDVILTAHTHDALPAPLRVGDTLLIASGCHGKFLGRLDCEVSGGRLVGVRHRLIPVFSDAITPDAEMAALVQRHRAPHAQHLDEVLGRTGQTLWRRGNLAGTWDTLICDSLLAGRDAEIALSPAFRWGPALLAGEDITREALYEQTAMTYPAAYRVMMTGTQIRAMLEDVADNLYHPDPYFRQGGDMVRTAGLSYALDIGARMGGRISDLRLLRTGAPIEAERAYAVAGWASVTEGVEGPPVWDLVASHISAQGGEVQVAAPETVRVTGG